MHGQTAGPDTIPGVTPPQGNVQTQFFNGDSLPRNQPRFPGDTLGFGPDSLRGRRDSTAKSDTSWVVYLDSTVRVAQFVHHRYDSPSVQFFPRENYSMYGDIRSPAYKRELKIDTLGQSVTVREQVNGVDVKPAATMTFDDYISNRLRQERMQSWRALARQYQMKDTRDELGNVLSSLTNIEIPVPANPLLDIFGGKSVKIGVSGAVDIRAAFRNQSTDQVTLSRLDQSQSTPDFNQDVQINVNGLIGDKLKILADWNTQRTFEYENQLHINYTGYDDEIVQSVEAGNVSLSTPSLVGGGQALFGIKARFQAGPLRLTTLLSQKKGQSKEQTLTGGATTLSKDIKPEEYSKSYYFIDPIYAQFWEQLHAQPSPIITDDIQNNQILQIDVWKTVPQLNSTVSGIALDKKAYVKLPPHRIGEVYQPGFVDTLDTSSVGNYQHGYWIRLDPTKDYRYDGYGGYIVFTSSVEDAQAYAVSYTIVGPQDPTNPNRHINMVYGDTIAGGAGYLKLIKPVYVSEHPEYRPAWDLMLKNVYWLGAQNIEQKDFDLKVGRRTDEAEIFQIQNANLLEVLGLDRFDQNYTAKPDGAFDFIKGLTIDVSRGDLIFPTLKPFSDGIVEYFKGQVGDSLLFRQLYDTTTSAAAQLNIVNRYVIHVHSSQASSSGVFPLGFNVVEGSVQVLLDGTPLQAGVDYTVDYILGQVTVRNQQALAPGRNLQVKYEQNDLFQLASKTLVGARGELTSILPNTNFGFTIMNLNQATLSDKVRVGEEPTSNTIMGVDGTSMFDLPILTSAISAIPFLKTREPSNMRISGEAAYILPNPNTKTSTIVSDNNTSVAYLDDFEGAKRTIPVSNIYAAWHLASPPLGVSTLSIPDSIIPETVRNGKDTATMRTYIKARLAWYNNSTCFEPVSVSEIYGNRKQVRTGEEFVSVLGLNFDPSHRGPYNFSPNLGITLHRDNGPSPDPEARRNNWAGVTQYLNNTGNLLDQNIAYLEIWMRSTSDDPNDLLKGRLKIDIGRISEDVIPNGRLNSEDIIPVPENPQGIPTGVVHPGQDLGLDMLASSDPNAADDEVRHYADFLNSNAGDPDVSPADPSGDDWNYSTCSADISHINGTEGNSKGPTGNRPDTEDLNSNGVVDNANQYVEYDVPLDSMYIDSTGLTKQNPLIVGGGDNKWYQFRIPLLSVSSLVGSGITKEDVLKNVQYIRMWMTGFRDPASIKIAEMNFVGSQWQQRVPNDTILKPSVVNIEDNPEYNDAEYQSLGITRERDKTNPNQIIAGNEQSLALLINGLQRGESRHLYRSFAFRPLDIFNYKEMKMFVHGDRAFNYYAPDRYDAEVFLRFGSDTLNYYEYRVPVHPGWHPDNQITINFAKLTAIKAERDSANQVFTSPDPEHRGAFYGIRGNPSLRQIREIMIGVTNPLAQGGTTPLVGQIWVNELRLTNVNNTKGYAYRFDSQVKVADLGTISFNYSHVDPNFHGLADQFGSQNTSINWAVNTSVSLDKFFPQSWQGTSIGGGYTHSEALVKPKYLPNSDVVVSEAATRVASKAGANATAAADSVTTTSQSLQVSDSYSIPNFRLALPTQAWYLRDTFNKLVWSFQYSKSTFRDPSIAQRYTWQWSFRLNYGVQFPSDGFIQPFSQMFRGIPLLSDFKDWKLYYLPIMNLTASVGGQRNRNYQATRIAGSLPTDTRTFGAGKSFGFDWKLTEGGLLNPSGNYTLAIDRNLLNLDNDSMGRGFGSILKSMLFGGTDSRYAQHLAVNSKPKILGIFDIDKYLDLNAGYSVNYSWQNTFQPNDIGKSSGWDNSIALGLNFRLKALTDNWFAVKEMNVSDVARQAAREAAERQRAAAAAAGAAAAKDTSAAKKEKEKEEEKAPAKGSPFDVLGTLRTLAKTFIKIPFLDYENIGINFTQGNRVGNSGVRGKTGFMNFWGRLPFQGSVVDNGPSRLYQLGLVSDPGGTLQWAPRSSFPFVGWNVLPGLRAPGARLADQFSQSNQLSLKTNRPLWTGAALEISWKVGWQFSRSLTFNTDSLGLTMPDNQVLTTGGSIERSYLTFPPVLIFKGFKSNLEDVGKKYDEYIGSMTPAEALTKSFEKGMEALPFLNRVFGQYVPRPNWNLRWDGIEKVAGLNSVFDKLSLEHSYSGSFRRDYRGDPSGGDRTDMERVTYGFSPLAGVNMGFKEFFKGTLNGTLRYNSTSTYDLNVVAQNIVETYAQEMSLTLSYSRRGFKLPLFGLNLSNDIDLSLTFSRTKNSRRSYDPALLSADQNGTPLEGNTRTLMEPRITYTLSTRVRAALFYRYQKTAPDEGASLLFGTTTNEAGLDIHITI